MRVGTGQAEYRRKHIQNLEDRINQLTTRNAELEAEVGRYKEAMQSIVDDYKQAFHTDWTTAANYADIARNALKESGL